MTSRKVGEIVIRLQRSELRIVNRGHVERLVGSDPSQCPSGFGEKDTFLSWVYGGYFSHKGLMTCFREEGHGVLSAPAFSQFLSA